MLLPPTFALLTGVPFVKNSPRAPFGPSVVFMDGIPLLGIGIVLQKSAPAKSEICKLCIRFKNALYIVFGRDQCFVQISH